MIDEEAAGEGHRLYAFLPPKGVFAATAAGSGVCTVKWARTNTHPHTVPEPRPVPCESPP